MGFATKNLFSLLTGHDLGGTWALGACGNSDPLPTGIAWQGGNPASGIITIADGDEAAPAALQTLSFNYSVGVGTCNDCVDGVLVDILEKPFAGQAGINQNVCQGDATLLNLPSLITGGNPTQLTGPATNWNDDDTSGVVLTDPTAVDVSALAVGTYHYTYTAPASGAGLGDCAQVQQTLTLMITVAPSSGTFNAVADNEVCIDTSGI